MAAQLRGGVGAAGYCPGCRQHVPAGPDACLGMLPGVSHACCGHGGLCEPYVVLGGEPDEGVAHIPLHVTLRGDMALVFFALVAGGTWGIYRHEAQAPGAGPLPALYAAAAALRAHDAGG